MLQDPQGDNSGDSCGPEGDESEEGDGSQGAAESEGSDGGPEGDPEEPNESQEVQLFLYSFPNIQEESVSAIGLVRNTTAGHQHLV